MIAIRPGCPERRRVMTFLIELKIDTEKCWISILWSASGIQSLLYVPKEQGTMQRSSLMLLYPGWLKILCQEVAGRCSKDG
jgi:hypothetical protein